MDSASDLNPPGSRGIQMRKQDFENLIKSVKQAGKIRRGEMKAGKVIEFKPADIRSIRQRLHKSQSELAMMIGVSVSTLQNWEQGRRKPEGPARVLFKIASENPKAVVKSLSS
jgi:putative transcriptional regulator